jgi:hypothetical protein
MTRQQVESILGPSNVSIILGSFGMHGKIPGSHDVYWVNVESQLIVLVEFDRFQAVVGKQFRQDRPLPLIKCLEYRWERFRNPGYYD